MISQITILLSCKPLLRKKKLTLNTASESMLTINELWLDVYSCKTVEEAAELLVKKLQIIIDKSTNSVKMKHKDRKRNPWINNHIVKTVNHKKHLYKIMKACPTNENIEKYRNTKKELEIMIEKAKKRYVQYEITRNANNPTALWKTMQQQKTKINKNITKLTTATGDVLENTIDIANHFVKYFTNIGKELASKIPKNKTSVSQPKPDLEGSGKYTPQPPFSQRKGTVYPKGTNQDDATREMICGYCYSFSPLEILL
nr:unnamed protein product [Callosobruchus analis]